MTGRWYDHRVFRLLATLFLINGVVVALELLMVLGLIGWTHFRRVPPPMWTEVVATATTYGTFAGQLLMLSLVGGLFDKARWSVWLAVLPLAILLALGFVAFEIGPGLYVTIISRDYDQMRVLSLMIVVGSCLPIILCYGSVLLASVILWPVKVFAGWRVAWNDDPIASVRSAPVSRLMLWVGLWAALFLLATRCVERFGEDGIFVALVGGLAILVTGLPIVLLVSSKRWRLLRWSVTVAYVLLLSWGESELIYWILKPPGFTTVGRVLVMVLAFNASLAGIAALNCSLLNWLGLRLHMPLPWWPAKCPASATSTG